MARRERRGKGIGQSTLVNDKMDFGLNGAIFPIALDIIDDAIIEDHIEGRLLFGADAVEIVMQSPEVEAATLDQLELDLRRYFSDNRAVVSFDAPLTADRLETLAMLGCYESDSDVPGAMTGTYRALNAATALPWVGLLTEVQP